MIPISYTEINGEIKFFYNQEEFNQWKKRGLEYGDSGTILVSRKANQNNYKIFGTIERPCKIMCTYSIDHSEEFDGKMLTPEEIINYKPTGITSISSRIVILDMNNIECVKLKTNYEKII